MNDENMTPDQGESVSIGDDVALQELHRFADAHEIDLNERFMSKDDIDDLRKLEGMWCRAMARGRLVLNDNNEPVVTTVDGKQITIREPSGAALMEMDRVGKHGGDITKLHRVMSAMTGEMPKSFASMKARDWKLFSSICTLFMG